MQQDDDAEEVFFVFWFSLEILKKGTQKCSQTTTTENGNAKRTTHLFVFYLKIVQFAVKKPLNEQILIPSLSETKLN